MTGLVAMELAAQGFELLLVTPDGARALAPQVRVFIDWIVDLFSSREGRWIRGRETGTDA